jgi:hypothetical protein
MGYMMSIQLLIVLVMAILPALLVTLSSKVSGGSKIGWAMIAFFFSWIGFAVFLIVSAALPARANRG